MFVAKVGFDWACEVCFGCCEVPELKAPNSAKRSADMVVYIAFVG